MIRQYDYTYSMTKFKFIFLTIFVLDNKRTLALIYGGVLIRNNSYFCFQLCFLIMV